MTRRCRIQHVEDQQSRYCQHRRLRLPGLQRHRRPSLRACRWLHRCPWFRRFRQRRCCRRYQWTLQYQCWPLLPGHQRLQSAFQYQNGRHQRKVRRYRQHRRRRRYRRRRQRLRRQHRELRFQHRYRRCHRCHRYRLRHRHRQHRQHQLPKPWR